MTKRIAAIGTILIAIYLGLGGVALAAYPHGEFAGNPDACAACHRAHTAISQNLLAVSSGNALCTTCHWGGTGADTDVKNGFYNAGGEPNNEWGANGGTLLGGGFDNIGGTAASTSKHVLGQPIAPPGTDTGAEITLNCVSCHTPHMDNAHKDQYRLLRLRPNGNASDIVVTWNGPWTDHNTQTTHLNDGDRAYTEKDFDPDTPGIQYYTNNYKDNVDEWCIACHTRYNIRGDANGQSGDPYDAGDVYGTIPRFRHAVDLPIKGETDPFNNLVYDLTTDLPLEDVNGNGRDANDKMTCITCHRGHGTAVVMTGNADFINSDYGNDRGALPTDSMLLRLDNRGVCVACHSMGAF